VIIRVDFSSKIGLGHLKRIETFVKKYNIKNPVIICKKCDEKLTKLPVIKIKNEKEFFQKVKELKPKKVIVDNYNFTYENEKEFKKLFPEIKLKVFDDTYERHFCDEIINVNLYAKKEKYNGKIPPFCKVTILPPLIRDEFKKQKEYKKEGIFVSFGGTDAKGIGLKVLKELKKLKFPINFYTTSSNKNLIKLKRFCQVNKWCKLHVDENVAKGMAKSRFAIITPSTITWEAIYMDLPFIAIEIADNQKYISKYLKEKRVPVLKMRDIRKIGEKLYRFNIR
jgi:UDP-2,4-diacetamido-2,4,6-trideoxy-beta-L-altropyranose hydrolase